MDTMARSCPIQQFYNVLQPLQRFKRTCTLPYFTWLTPWFGLVPCGGTSVSEPLWVQSSGFRVQGSGFRVQGSGFRVRDSGHLGSVSALLSDPIRIRVEPLSCRSNMAHKGQSMPDSGLNFQVKARNIFLVVSSLLGGGGTSVRYPPS